MTAPRTRRLVYWVADCLNDRRCYSIRARTRREAKEALAAQGEYAKDYGPVRKVVVEFADAFDLVRQALGEGGIEPWE